GCYQIGKAKIDFALPCGSNFVMMAFDVNADGRQQVSDFRSQILQTVGWRNRNVAFFWTNVVTLVVLTSAHLPMAFIAVDLVARCILIIAKTDVIKYKEFGFRTKISGIGDAGKFQIGFCTLSDASRIEVVTLFRYGVDYVADHANSGFFKERIDP